VFRGEAPHFPFPIFLSGPGRLDRKMAERKMKAGALNIQGKIALDRIDKIF
jgi:hypothetical protein